METLHQRRRKKATRVRGYHMRVWYQGEYTSERPGPVLWAAEPHLPPEWEAIKNNPKVVKAILIRSGRPFEQFTRPRASAHQQPGQSNRE